MLTGVSSVAKLRAIRLSLPAGPDLERVTVVILLFLRRPKLNNNNFRKKLINL